jgi:hypothetical protein
MYEFRRLKYVKLHPKGWPCHSSGGYSSASHRDDPRSIPDQADKATLRKVSSGNFDFPCRFSFHQMLFIHL